MEIPPDPTFAVAIDKALELSNGLPFHIDAIARVLNRDVEADRLRNGYAARALVRRGYLEAPPVAVDQGDDLPCYIDGWTAKGKKARVERPRWSAERT